MSTTPETDSRAWSDHSEGILHEVVEANFARKLERERDEAREALREIAETVGGAISENASTEFHGMVADEVRLKILEITRERDEARKIASDLVEQAVRLQKQMGKNKTDGYYLESKLAQANRERDEAREEAAKWESSFEAMERAGAEQARRADHNQEWALSAERDRDEAREKLAHVTAAAQAVVDRWEQPAWKDTEPTATVIYRLRNALGREAE